MTNSADPDQLASSEANWSGSTLFAKIGHVVLSKRRVKVDLKVKMIVNLGPDLWCLTFHSKYTERQKYPYICGIFKLSNPNIPDIFFYIWPINAEWTLLPHLFGLVHFLYKECLVSFYHCHIL